MRKFTTILTLGLLVTISPTLVSAKTSHQGWPQIDGKLAINSGDANRTLRGLPNRHNELLGGNGNDTLIGGNAGDVLWGDYKPGNQSRSQVDRIYAGNGNDFIYTSHGTNYVYTGGGRDIVHAHFGRGEIHCQSPQDVVFLSRKSKRDYKLFGCSRISFAAAGH